MHTSAPHRWLSRALLPGILLLGLALRLAPWDQNRFLEDEALYAYWGLQIATGADPLLDYEPVDKPPLHSYLLAASLLLSGSTSGGRAAETAARLPSLLASMVSIALVYALGKEMGRGTKGEEIGLLAALLLALSPFDVLFASTAFTDPLLVALVLAGLLAAARGRAGWAGLFAALAAATKQQGLFFLPLILALLFLHARSCSPGPASRFAAFRHFFFPVSRPFDFFLPFVVIMAGILAWDAARLQRPGFWQQGLIAYGGLGLAGTGELAGRAADWLRLAGSFWGSPLFNGLALAALLAWAGGAAAGRLPRWTRADLALALFVIAFVAGHWLVGFQVWDRYLLGLVPLLALLLARALLALSRSITRPVAPAANRVAQAGVLVLGLVMALAATGPAVQAAHSKLPVGGDHGAYDGIDDLAAIIRAQAPSGAVLYHHWLGYHHRFYLYGAPLRLHWYPDVQDLAHDAHVYRREPRYIAFPSFRDDQAARAALAAAGIVLVPVAETRRRDGSVSFRLYRLRGPEGEESGIREQEPGIWDLGSGIRDRASGIRDQGAGSGRGVWKRSSVC